MGYYDVKKAKVSILDMLKYDAVQDVDGVICKDMGGYVQMLVPMNNANAHDTYEVYFTADGQIEKVFGHPKNSGFTGTKYY